MSIHFAAVDSDGMDLAIWGVGDTHDEAIADAEKQEGFERTEHFKIVSISAEECFSIEKHGGGRAPQITSRPAVATATSAAKFGYEVRTRDGWSADAAGAQDSSNCFATRGEAEPGIAGLAGALGISEDDIRVADLNNPRHDSVS